MYSIEYSAIISSIPTSWLIAINTSCIAGMEKNKKDSEGHFPAKYYQRDKFPVELTIRINRILVTLFASGIILIVDKIVWV